MSIETEKAGWEEVTQGGPQEIPPGKQCGWDSSEKQTLELEEEVTDDRGFCNCYGAKIGCERWMLKRLKSYIVVEAKDVKLSDEDHTRTGPNAHGSQRFGCHV